VRTQLNTVVRKHSSLIDALQFMKTMIVDKADFEVAGGKLEFMIGKN
jgi:hypothetical protein